MKKCNALDYVVPENDRFQKVEGRIISFKIQDGPIKENGLNGCQVFDMLKSCLKIYQKLNEKFECKENEATIAFIKHAIEAQEKRTKDRENRKVEGYNKE